MIYSSTLIPFSDISWILIWFKFGITSNGLFRGGIVSGISIFLTMSSHDRSFSWFCISMYIIPLDGIFSWSFGWFFFFVDFLPVFWMLILEILFSNMFYNSFPINFPSYLASFIFFGGKYWPNTMYYSSSIKHELGTKSLKV